MTKKFILITPAKDEGNNLPELISSITSQEIIPVLWIIVDDGSIDSTPKIITEASKKYSWIHSIRLEPAPRDIGFKYSRVCMTGFENAIKYSQKNNIEYGYIALLDADMRLETDYFKKLIERMENDESIGIASGTIWSKVDRKYIEEKRGKSHPTGAARIWRKKCFEETNGYELVIGPDSVSTARAKLKGWKTIGYEDLKAYQSRPVGSAEGLWKGYYKYGEAHYFRRLHILIVLAKGFLLISKGHVNLAIAYLWGYYHALITKMPRLADPELAKYFRTKSINTFLGGES